MDRRFSVRRDELLAECEVRPQVFQGMVGRMARFLEPFVGLMVRPEQRQHALTCVRGLLSDLRRKNVGSIADRDDQDRGKLQHFVGVAEWDHRPLQQELARQVGRELGRADGVMVFDPSAFPKTGKPSAGVARQWRGRLGKVDNCQRGVDRADVSHEEHALPDMRLYLPKEWTSDRARCKRAGVPPAVRFHTRHEQAPQMLEENGGHLPQAWVAGDGESGQSAGFRRDLHERRRCLNDLIAEVVLRHGILREMFRTNTRCVRHETSLLAVPSNMAIRGLDAGPPPYRGHGPVPKRSFEQVRHWCAARGGSEWPRVFVRDGEKGPLDVERLRCRVEAKHDRRRMPYEETLAVIRDADEEGTAKIGDDLSDAPADTPLPEFARVPKAAHRVEECLKRSQSEASLADDVESVGERAERSPYLEGLASSSDSVAAGVLVSAHRITPGKTMGPGNHRSSNPRRAVDAASHSASLRHAHTNHTRDNPSPQTKRTRPLRSPQNT